MTKMRILSFACLLCLSSGIGCIPRVASWDPLPVNISKQLANTVDCKEEMLFIPLISGNFDLFMGEPFVIQYPFEGLRKKFESYEYGLVSVIGGLGSKSHLLAFLLIGSDGVVYDVDVADGPSDYPEYDLRIYRAKLTEKWRNELMLAMQNHSAATGKGKGKSSYIEGFWCLSSVRGIIGEQISWEKPDQSLAAAAAFFKKYPLKTSADGGAWKKYWKPMGTTQYCGKSGKTPNFAAEEFLLLKEERVQVKHSAYIRQNYYYGSMVFPDGSRPDTQNDIKAILRQFLDRRQYKVIVYCPAPGTYDDPERTFKAEMLRHFAREYDLDFLVLSPDEPDGTATEYPGIPGGIRRYWQCIGCLKGGKNE